MSFPTQAHIAVTGLMQTAGGVAGEIESLASKISGSEYPDEVREFAGQLVAQATSLRAAVHAVNLHAAPAAGNSEPKELPAPVDQRSEEQRREDDEDDQELGGD